MLLRAVLVAFVLLGGLAVEVEGCDCEEVVLLAVEELVRLPLVVGAGAATGVEAGTEARLVEEEFWVATDWLLDLRVDEPTSLRNLLVMASGETT